MAAIAMRAVVVAFALDAVWCFPDGSCSSTLSLESSANALLQVGIVEGTLDSTKLSDDDDNYDSNQGNTLALNAIWSQIQDLERKFTNGTDDADGLIHQLEDAIQQAGQKVNEGHTEEEGKLKKQTDQYDKLALDADIKTICETGFNGGHSAARFLSQSEAHLYEFDLGAHDYAKTAETFLMGRFPSRLQVTWGDSTKTLPEFRAAHPDIKCDLVIVDGGHDQAVADADLKNFASMASSSHYLLIDDTPCNAGWCQGPTQAWVGLVQQGCIKESMRFAMGETRGFTQGRYTPCPLWPNLGQ